MHSGLTAFILAGGSSAQVKALQRLNLVNEPCFKLQRQLIVSLRTSFAGILQWGGGDKPNTCLSTAEMGHFVHKGALRMPRQPEVL